MLFLPVGDKILASMPAVELGIAILMSSVTLGVCISGGVLFRLFSYSFCHCWLTSLFEGWRRWLFNVAGLAAAAADLELMDYIIS